MNTGLFVSGMKFKSYIIDIFRKPFENPLVSKEDNF